MAVKTGLWTKWTQGTAHYTRGPRENTKIKKGILAALEAMPPSELAQMLRNVLPEVTDCIHEAEHHGSVSDGNHMETGYKTGLSISGANTYQTCTPASHDEPCRAWSTSQGPLWTTKGKGLSLPPSHQRPIAPQPGGGAL